MNYDKRCTITYPIEIPDFLGTKIVESEPKIIPCSETSLSMNEHVAFFGGYKKSACKLHLQGNYEEIHSITYKGVTRTVFDLRFHRNSTVVVLQ